MLAVLAACGPTAPTAEEIAKNSADLVAYLDAEYEEEVQESPQEMTSQGRKNRYGELDDRSEAAMDKNLAWRRESVADMKEKFDPEALSEDARLSYEIWELELARAEKSAEFRRHRYIFGRNGAHTGLVNFMINQHRVDEKSDMEAYISRVAAIGPTLDVLIDRAKLAAGDGIRMPGFAYDQTVSEVARVTTGAPFAGAGETALFADGKAKIAALQTATKITPEEATALTEQLRVAMVDKMKPAYDRLAAWATEDKANASPTPQGVGSLPNGEAYYNAMLSLMTTTEMTADEIHQLGLSEVARIHGEMEKVKTEAGFEGHAAGVLRLHAHGQAVLPVRTTMQARRSTSTPRDQAHRGDEAGAAEVFRTAAESRSDRETRRAVSRRAGRRAALPVRHAGWHRARASTTPTSPT
jgi:uncharacterized protein (DUF885 family)